MPKVIFISEGIQMEAAFGETLLDVQIRAGLQPNAPCGGKGTCGKCLLDVRETDSDRFVTVHACQTRVTRDIEVHTICTEKRAHILTDASDADIGFDPQVEIAEIHMEPCARGESTSDWERFRRALNLTFGARDWKPNLRLASVLGERARADGGVLKAVVCGNAVLEARADIARCAMIAFDIGTTSIAGYLIDAIEGTVTARAGMLNPQRQFGADVIQRANHALEGGMDDLSGAVRGALNELTERLCDASGIRPEEIYCASAVGNSCMHHLLLNISPASLVRAPYNPAISESLVVDSEDIGLHIHPGAPVLLPPVIAGFVGADTVGCLLAGHWENRRKITLMIDIGTNGEIVLGNSDRRIACSTAAGPAFEGAKISCGMRGAEGAIDHVRVEEGRIKWHVIGEGEPIGICGSGLIDLVAALLAIGEIDGGGKLAHGDAYHLENTTLTLTQKDIREVQLAKAAICAGIRLMAERLNIPVDDIAQVDIAGAFGCYMDPQSAMAIGLLPAELRNTPINAVGNAAGEGACMILKNREVWTRAARLTQNTEFLELATIPDFQDAYIDALEFTEEDE